MKFVACRQLTEENWDVVLDWADMAFVPQTNLKVGDWILKADDGRFYGATDEAMAIVKKHAAKMKNH